MFNVGGGELLVILLLALLVLGPDRLPEFAKKAGKVMSEVRRVSQGFQSEIRQAMDFNEDKPEPNRIASPSTPRLVEPPLPAADSPENVASAPASEPTPPVSAPEHADTAHSAPDRAVPDRAVPDRAVPDRSGPDRAVPEHRGDESASGSSAA